MDYKMVAGAMRRLELLRKIQLRSAMTALGLHPGQPPMLEFILAHPGCTQKEAADELDVSPASAAASLKRLEKAGLVARRQDAQDVRRNQLELTAAGEAKVMAVREKMDALDVFHPARMADRILGMGDVVSLVERAQEQYNEEEARRISKKIAKNQFDFNDFLSQLEQIKKMGSMKDLMGMIPGMDKALKGVEISDDAFKPIEAIISSMTPAERANPALLNGSRKERIAKGSGTSIVEVNRFLKQFEQTSKMMRKVQQMKRR